MRSRLYLVVRNKKKPKWPVAHNFGAWVCFYDRSNATIRGATAQGTREHAISNLNRRRPSFPPFPPSPRIRKQGNSSPFLSISRGESFSDDDFCTGEGQGQVTRRKEVRRRVHIGQNTRDLYLRWGFLLLREEREERAEAGFYFFLHLICKVLFPPSIFRSLRSLR